MQHHLDEDSGVVVPPKIESFLAAGDATADADYYICGPAPFMDTVEKTVIGAGVAGDRVHLERFSVAPTAVPTSNDADAPVTTEVTIQLDRTHHHRAVPRGQHRAADREDGRPASTVLV